MNCRSEFCRSLNEAVNLINTRYSEIAASSGITRASLYNALNARYIMRKHNAHAVTNYIVRKLNAGIAAKEAEITVMQNAGKRLMNAYKEQYEKEVQL